MPNHDLMETIFEGRDPIVRCLDHGFVRLVDFLPRSVPEGETSADYAVAEAARCSYNRQTKTKGHDIGLIRYLMRHDHTSPLEMVEFKFDIKLPIFVARQMIRHRTVNVNELSGRYAQLPSDFYMPEEVRVQSTTNHQGSGEKVDPKTEEQFLGELYNLDETAYTAYEYHIDQGVAREQARMLLPINIYTQWYWKIDLHNLLHFLDLRCDSHSQYEIRVYAEAILELISKVVPLTLEAWEDYSQYRGGMKLTRYEIEAIRKGLSNTDISIPEINADNKFEQAEWEEKAIRLGLL